MEDMATTLLPILQAAGKHERAVAVHHVGSLREGLLQICKAVQELGRDETTLPQDSASPRASRNGVRARRRIARIDKRRSGYTCRGLRSRRPEVYITFHAHSRCVTSIACRPGRSVQPVRDVLETVIRRAERPMAQSAEGVDAELSVAS